jgi:membrane protein
MDGSPWLGRARGVIDRVRTRVSRTWQGLRRRYRWVGVAGDVQERFGEVKGGYLAGAVTLAAFLSVFPLLLLGVSVLGFFSSGNPDLATTLLENLGVPSGSDIADLVREALATAEESRRGASVVGLVGLLWSGLGLVSALQYAYDSAWQVTGRGIRDKALGFLWLVGAALLFAASFALTAATQFLPWFLAPVEIVLALAVAFFMFLWAEKLLPNRDIGWRPLVPGAIAGMIGFEVLKVVGSMYVPRAVSSSSALYGSSGVVFAILAWLFFFGRLVVYSTVLNVVLWERTHGTVTIDLEVPSLPGREAEPVATRSGDAIPAN